MPFRNLKTGREYPFRVSQASSLRDRLIGLLGTENLDPEMGLYITPCSGIHTFGMKYPIDVLFLDEHGYIIESISHLEVNKITKVMPAAKSVLELAAGTIHKYGIHTGDQIQITIDEIYHPENHGIQILFHWPVNIFIALLWSRFVYSSIRIWTESGGLMNSSILIHNTIIFILFLIRKKSRNTSYRIIDWLIPFATICCTMWLHLNTQVFSSLNDISYLLQILGLVFIIISILSLGRSFGIVPAKRDIKSNGAYKIIRHPLYASEMIYYFGFLLGNPTLRNVILIVIILCGQIYRALREEHLLSRDPSYLSYKTEVKYRFIPGIY